MLLPFWERAMPKKPPARGNRVLSRLSRADLRSAASRTSSPSIFLCSKPLETGNSRIDSIYFIDHGFASVVADGPGKRDIEVGIIGREGMTGLAVVLGEDRARHTPTCRRQAPASA